MGHPTKTGVKAALLNTQKQTEGGCQIEDTKKYDPNERTDKTPEKDLHKTEINNLPDTEFKALVIRMLRELTEYGHNIKEEIKVTLSEIRKIHTEPSVEGKKWDSNQ